MHSLSPAHLASLRFGAQSAATLRALGEHMGRQQLYEQQAPEVLKKLRQIAIVESTQSSTRLEGVVVSAARLRSLVLHSTTPQNRSEQEVAGYRDALALIHESAAHMPLTVGVIKQLHHMLYRYMPQEGGQFKSADNDIVERLPDGSQRLRFHPVAAHLTPMAMEDLTRRYQAAAEQHLADPIILVPLAILDFLCIHPFPDGNGRVSRLLTTLLLEQCGYSAVRYISLERIFEDSKESYYAALHTSSQGWHQAQHNVHPWLDYFLGALLRAYKEFEERASGVAGRGRGGKQAHIREYVLAQVAPFSISDVERARPGVSRDTIRLVLRDMKAEGLIAPIGKGRGAKWVVCQSANT